MFESAYILSSGLLHRSICWNSWHSDKTAAASTRIALELDTGTFSFQLYSISAVFWRGRHPFPNPRSLCVSHAFVAPLFLADDLCRTADVKARHCLRSASSPSLVVRRTRLSTYGDRAFPVAASRVWNSLPHHVTSAQSLPVFCSRLKTHLFSRSFR